MNESQPQNGEHPELHVYEPQGRRSRFSNGESARLQEEARAALEKVNRLRTQGVTEESLELQGAILDFENTNLDFENNDLEHDPTGAWKRERFGVDVASQMKERFAADKEGLPPVGTPESVTPVFMVNMGELDRLNKAGHDFGDKALAMAAEKIDAAVSGYLAEQMGLGTEQSAAAYELYRLDSNSFGIRFKTAIGSPHAEAIKTLLTAEAGQSGIDLQPGLESPPLVTDYVAMEEIPSLLPHELRDGEKAETLAVDAMKDVLFSLNDIRKTVTRFERVKSLLDQGKTQEAEELYTKFLKKSLGGLVERPDTGKAAEDWEDVKEAMTQLGEGYGDVVWDHAYHRTVEGLRKRYETRADYREKVELRLGELIKQERGREVAYVGRVQKQEDLLPVETAESNGFAYPDKKTATSGLREIQTKELDVARWKHERDQATEGPQKTLLEKRVLKAEKELRREKAHRDSATGFELRGQLFHRLESALEAGNRPLAVVSMDMGFLKYFDQVGGKATGDLAILKVAEVFDKVRADFSKDGVEVSVHRVGGDEFSMTVIGGENMPEEAFRARMTEVTTALSLAVENAGKIPPQAGSKPGYYASKLNVGIGVHLYANAEAAEREAQEAGLAVEPVEPMSEADRAKWKRNQHAEHLLLISDKLMEFQKSTSRFALLTAYYEKMNDPDLSPDKKAVAEAHFKKLRDFSEKSTFGTGDVKVKEFYDTFKGMEEPGKTEALSDEIHAFVWEQMRRESAKEEGNKRELERNIEQAVHLKYLDARIADLSEHVERLQKRYGKEHETYLKTKARLDEAEQTAEAIRATRAKLAA